MALLSWTSLVRQSKCSTVVSMQAIPHVLTMQSPRKTEFTSSRADINYVLLTNKTTGTTNRSTETTNAQNAINIKTALLSGQRFITSRGASLFYTYDCNYVCVMLNGCTDMKGSRVDTTGVFVEIWNLHNCRVDATGVLVGTWNLHKRRVDATGVSINI